MIDRPTPVELVRAVRQYLEADLLPGLTDARQRFQTLVAAHVLGIVERELPREDELLADEVILLTVVLQPGTPPVAPDESFRAAALRANEELCVRIRAGAFDEPAALQTLLRQLRPLVVRKLEIANPRFLTSGG